MQMSCKWKAALWPWFHAAATPAVVRQSSAPPPNSDAAATAPRRASPRRRNWPRTVHSLIGVVAALNLLLLIMTGFLLQHRDLFRLEERVVSRKLLPAGYRPQDGLEVRGDIVVADLHSGRLFGGTGALVLDGVTLGWLLLLVTGLVMYATGARGGNNNAAGFHNAFSKGSAGDGKKDL